MKIKITVTEEKEKEVELPYYCKNGLLYLKVKSENEVIAVTTYDFNTSISLSGSQRWEGVIVDAFTMAVTEQEFDEALSKAYDVIQSKIGILS